MLRLLADENFNGDILRGLMLRELNAEIIRVQDIDLLGADDPAILDWAAENDYILLTHDRATMPEFAYQRLAESQAMGGVLVFDDQFPIGLAIEELVMMSKCSEQQDWRGLVVYLPL